MCRVLQTAEGRSFAIGEQCTLGNTLRHADVPLREALFNCLHLRRLFMRKIMHFPRVLRQVVRHRLCAAYTFKLRRDQSLQWGPTYGLIGFLGFRIGVLWQPDLLATRAEANGL